MRRTLLVLLVIVGAGGVLRFDAAATPSAYQSKDEQSYAMIARGLASHGHYGNPGMGDPVHWVPGAPLLFAAAHRLDTRSVPGGVWDVPAAYRWQAAVGTLTIVAAFALAFLLAGRAAGLVSAGAIALYPPLISASRDLLSEPLGALLATSALAATAWAVRDPGRRSGRAALAGALFAGTVLTRADLALLPLIGAFALVAAAWRPGAALRSQAGGAVRAVLPFLATLLALVTPWTVFASAQAGTFVPLSNGGGSNLFVGTHLPGDGTMFGVKRELAAEAQRRLPAEKRVRSWANVRQRDVIRAVVARRPGLSEEAALKAEGAENLRRYALGRPVAFAAMMSRKVWRLWGGYAVGTHRHRRAPVTMYHLALVGLGVAGLLAGLLISRRRILLLPAGALLYVSAVNALLVSESRHNLTLIPTLACAGVAGCALALRRLRAPESVGAALAALERGTPPRIGAASRAAGVKVTAARR